MINTDVQTPLTRGKSQVSVKACYAILSPPPLSVLVPLENLFSHLFTPETPRRVITYMRERDRLIQSRA